MAYSGWQQIRISRKEARHVYQALGVFLERHFPSGLKNAKEIEKNLKWFRGRLYRLIKEKSAPKL